MHNKSEPLDNRNSKYIVDNKLYRVSDILYTIQNDLECTIYMNFKEIEECLLL